MRVLQFFAKAFLFIGLTALFFYLLGAKLWLMVGSYLFEKDAKLLIQYAHEVGNYAKTCEEAPASSSTSFPIAFQLRFLDARNYTLEVVCSVIEDSPIAIKSGSLLPLLTKKFGSSGLAYNVQRFEPTAMTLTVFHEQQAVTLTADGVQKSLGVAAPAQSPVIKNTCVGFGYQCCSADSQSGDGAMQVDGITDCASSCYQRCQSVPYFSAFVSDPFPSTGKDIAMELDSLSITFSYTVDSSDAPIQSVVIDYGDGAQDESTEAVGLFTHTYSCASTCNYQVHITATDTEGKQSRVTETTQYRVVKK